MTLPFLSAQDVTKQYGDAVSGYVALRGASLQAAAGEFVVICGPSGCGKSTLLHIVGAMDQPTSGKVWLNGRRLDGMSSEALAIVRRRHIGFVFQTFNLLPTLTVIENTTLPLLLDGVSDREAGGRAAAALGDVGLASRSRHFPSQLSGGEMQRAAIARALVLNPELIIADEPTGSLDSGNGRRVLDLLAELNSSRGITVLMATHSEAAAAYASRAVHLLDGQIDKGQATGVFSETL